MSAQAPHPLLASNVFWAAHLNGLYDHVEDRADGSTFDGSRFTQELFSTTPPDLDKLYQSWLKQGGPAIRLNMGGGHEVAVCYRMEPDICEVAYEFASPDLEKPALLGLDGGHHVLPALRWAEVKAIAARTETPHLSTLLLLPSIYFNAAEAADARAALTAALGALCSNAATSSEFAGHVCEWRAGEITWSRHPELGWLTTTGQDRRCLNRPLEDRLSDHELSCFRKFTDFLGV